MLYISCKIKSAKQIAWRHVRIRIHPQEHISDTFGPLIETLILMANYNYIYKWVGFYIPCIGLTFVLVFLQSYYEDQLAFEYSSTSVHMIEYLN